MAVLADILAAVLLIAGAGFTLIGAIGLIRLPDFYTRMHAGGITDTLGAGLMLAGMMVLGGFTLVTAKLVLIGLFIFFTSPTATHAIASAARTMGLKPRGVPDDDPAPGT